MKKLNGHALLLEAFPEELHQLPGVAQNIAEFAFERGHRDTRIPATVAALLSVSILARREFIVYRASGQATALNLPVILEMASGAGKENLRGTISAVLYAADSTPLLLDACASGAALHKEMAGGPCRVMLVDEFGRYLAAAQDDGHKGALLSTMMSFITAALGIVPPKLYANTKESLPSIVMPYLVFGGMTTAKELDTALRSRDVVNGFLNRMLVIRTDDVRPTRKAGVNTARLGTTTVEALRRITTPAKLPGNGQAVNKGCIPGHHDALQGVPGLDAAYVVLWDELLRKIVPTATAEQQLDRIDALADVDYTGGRGDPVTTLWARAGELTLRVAGVLALAEAVLDAKLMADPMKPLPMTVEHVRWAERLVFWCVRNMIGVAHTELSEGSEDRARRKVLQAMAAIVNEPPAGKKAKARGWAAFNRKGWVPKSQLGERVRKNAPDLDQRTMRAALEVLESDGRLVVFDALDKGGVPDPRDEDSLSELPEGLSHADAVDMARRAQASKQLGAGIWYRLADD
jgi:hypothetical protein